MDFDSIIGRLEKGVLPSREEIAAVLDVSDETKLERLFSLADKVRRENVGDEIHIRSLIEISNYCRQDCMYCGLRYQNTNVRRYRMTDDEILAVLERINARNRKTVVLQSGEDAALTGDRIAELVRKIKSRFDIAITLSLGEYSRDDYAKIKESGADRYLLKHETFDRELYSRLDPDMDYDNRHRCLKDLRDLGFQVGGGFMVGLPEQTSLSLADDILFLRDFDFDMAGIGPFIPNPDTPLSDEPGGTFQMTLKVVAMTRILVPHLLMPATTAIGSIQPGGREKVFQCGANVVMPNATPAEYQDLYRIYPNRKCLNEAREDTDLDVEKMILALGRKVGTDYGHSLRGKTKPI